MSGQVVCHYIAEQTSSFHDPEIKKRGRNYVTIEAVLQDGDVQNRNRRVYPSEVIQEAADGKHVRERLESKTWYGEANHPFTDDLNRLQAVDMARVSHIITSFKREGENLFVGDVETFSRSPLGETMRGAIEQGSKVGFSMRGFAKIREDTKENSIKVVEGPMHIVTYDWVVGPSHKAAVMRGVKEEEIVHGPVDIGITETEVANFLTENSDRYNIFGDLLKGSKVSLSKDLRTVRFEKKDDTGGVMGAMRLEDYVIDLYRKLL